MNCQSINQKKAASLSDLILENNYQCVALTETLLSSSEEENSVVLSSFLPDGYNIFHVPRPTRGGGVGFVFRDHYHARLDTSFEFSSFECISVILEAGSFSFRFIVLYRVPPSTQNKIQKSSFLTDFGELIEQTSNLSGKLIILGDFNIHVDSCDDAEGGQFSDLLDAFGLKQHVSGSTHVRGHTLDLVISREADDIIQSCEVGTFASDHNAITFTLRSGHSHPKRKTISARKTKSINISNLASDIQSSELSQPLPDHVDDIVHCLDTVLRQLLDRHAPVKSFSVAQRLTQPWINDEILVCKRERRECEKLWRMTSQLIID